MGKGDVRTKKGKRFKKSNGNTRPNKKNIRNIKKKSAAAS